MIRTSLEIIMQFVCSYHTFSRINQFIWSKIIKNRNNNNNVTAISSGPNSSPVGGENKTNKLGCIPIKREEEFQFASANGDWFTITPIKTRESEQEEGERSEVRSWSQHNNDLMLGLSCRLYCYIFCIVLTVYPVENTFHSEMNIFRPLGSSFLLLL